MVIAGARVPKRISTSPMGLGARRTILRDDHQPFQHLSDNGEASRKYRCRPSFSSESSPASLSLARCPMSDYRADKYIMNPLT